jgi:hypothetical protein
LLSFAISRALNGALLVEFDIYFSIVKRPFFVVSTFLPNGELLGSDLMGSRPTFLLNGEWLVNPPFFVASTFLLNGEWLGSDLMVKRPFRTDIVIYLQKNYDEKIKLRDETTTTKAIGVLVVVLFFGLGLFAFNKTPRRNNTFLLSFFFFWLGSLRF